MYRPRFDSYHNPNFYQWSPHSRPRAPFLRRNFVANRFRPPGPVTIQFHEFWCETCDKGFQTLQILENHKLQHQKCNIDGCQFVAHPKVITKHIQMQHSTGFYKKIANLNNPEDIQKWREERKRKYPTKENIEKKAAEVKEKLERGEKMGITYNSNNKRNIKDKNFQGQQNRNKQNFAKGKNYQRHNSFKIRHESNLNPPAPKKICKIKPTKEEVCRLPAFAGIQQLVTDEEKNQEDLEVDNSLIEDDIFREELLTTENISTQLEPTVCGALTSLICNYGSSSDEDTVPENPCPNNPNKCEIDSKLNSEPEEKMTIVDGVKPIFVNNNVKSDDDSGPEEVLNKKEPIPSNVPNDICEKSKKNKIVKNNHVNIRQIKKPKYQLPSTLLVKLLSREIKQERNIILQCVHYVVKNNFFDDVDIKQ